ncbi:MAG: hypothetical protein DHS20C05_22880 [Hyphococcus sp.]|nr:MAG: hypothetical protein DHS20C05_22880 [Marinicaulis sp.]
MKRWRIWRAEPADEDDLVRIEAAAFGEKSWGENNVRESFVAPRVTILLAAPRQRMVQTLGAGSNQPPVGFAMWRDLGPEAEILTVGVIPEAARKGAGTELLSACLEGAKMRGANKVYLEVDQGNKAALALYGRAGFQQISVRRAYYRNGADAVVMECAL